VEGLGGREARRPAAGLRRPRRMRREIEIGFVRHRWLARDGFVSRGTSVPNRAMTRGPTAERETEPRGQPSRAEWPNVDSLRGPRGGASYIPSDNGLIYVHVRKLVALVVGHPMGRLLAGEWLPNLRTMMAS
jgi:hypothetical protein